MRKLLCIVGAIAIGGCSGRIDGPAGSTTSGGGGVMGRGLIQSTGDAIKVMGQRNVAVNVAADSQNFLRGQLVKLGLSSAHDDFQVLKTDHGMDGLDHVRLQQTYNGLKVFGGDVVVHANPTQFTGVAGNVLALKTGLDLTPALSAQSAVTKAKADYARAALNSDPLSYSRESQELGILPIEGGNALLAYRVSFYTELQAGIKPSLMVYYINAHDGSILKRYNAIHTATAEASGPGGNAKVSRTWNANLDVTQSGSSYAMDTAQYQTTNLNGGTSGTGTTYTSSSLTFSDAAGNDAHGFAEQTIKMLKDWFGYNSIDNKGFKILSRVHYSTKYENAFWDGQEMTYGDGDTYFYEMSGSLDVVAHEIDHGFTSYHSNLTYDGESGGMNESFSDIAGTAAKFYYDPASATFDLGGDILKPGTPLGTALRYMCDPTKDGSSIDNAKDYNGQDVHYSSGVMNKAFCRAAKRISGVNPDTGNATQDGVRKAAKAWFEANANYWTSSSDWTQGCQGTVDAAKALGYSATDIAAIGDSWKDVGVTCNYGGGGCTPQCQGKQCGDDGCGGSCGTCGAGQTCDSSGMCQGGGCTPQCSGKQCGDDGCGGTCGTCGAGQTCDASGQCQGGGCTPQCSGKQCGDDGCGGSCGTCGAGQTCDASGQCQGGGGACSHDICTTGSNLSSGCDPCVTSICAQDGYCCSTAWDNICVGEVSSICGSSQCSGGGGTCSHDICTTGKKLPSDCDPCVTSICGQDSYCCKYKWDSICVAEVGYICGESCN